MKPIFIFRLLTAFTYFSGVASIYAHSLPPFEPTSKEYRPIGLSGFLDELNKDNLSIKVKKLSADSATAIAKQAGRPNLNPILTYARGSIYTQAPYTGYTNPSSNTVGAIVTIEGWGKRSARQTHAQAELNRQAAELLAENRSIETQAIFAYVDALRTKLLWQSYQFSLNHLKPYRSEDADSLKKEYLAAQDTLSNDLKYYAFGLMNYLGTPDKELPLPQGTLNMSPENFNPRELVNKAIENRSDIHLGKAAVETANANMEVIKASKQADFLPGVYYTETPPYSTGGTSYGTQKSVSFLLSIPIGNGLINDSDLLVGSNAITEQEINLLATKTKIITEINQTWLQYQSAKDRLERAIKAYNALNPANLSNVASIKKFHDVEYELFDARTVHVKTLILLNRLSGNFAVPNLN